MKTKILALTLMIGLTAVVLAQTASLAGSAPAQPAPATTSPGNSGQTMPSPNGNQMNGVIPGVSTNNITATNTDLSNGTNGNNRAPDGNNTSGMTNGVNVNPYNPYAIWAA